MKILRHFSESEEIQKNNSVSLGFVPTMGALHEGHCSLIQESKKENTQTIVSIYVNPLQFNNQNDLENYPKTTEQDLSLLKKLEVDWVFLPDGPQSVFPSYYKIPEWDLSGFNSIMEGLARPGHFTGVFQIVYRLFQIINPTRAYLGEKDFQQLQLVRKLAQQFFPSTGIIGCPTVREKSGLAMSSRNQRLSVNGRKSAGAIFELLEICAKLPDGTNVEEIQALGQKFFSNWPAIKIDYLSLVEEDTLALEKMIDRKRKQRVFISVILENIRLIDNYKIES